MQAILHALREAANVRGCWRLGSAIDGGDLGFVSADINNGSSTPLQHHQHSYGRMLTCVYVCVCNREPGLRSKVLLSSVTWWEGGNK